MAHPPGLLAGGYSAAFVALSLLDTLIPTVIFSPLSGAIGIVALAIGTLN